MPRGDRTGPWSQGPMTGRAMGYCAGFTSPGFMSPGPGLGFGRGQGFRRGPGRGFGFGRGRGWNWEGYGRFGGYPYPPEASYQNFQPYSEEQEMDFLEDQVKALENQLKQIKKRQSEIKKVKTKE